MARVYDKDYNFWQNAQQKLQYEAYDKSWHGLPLVSNGAPPPLDEMVIDISQNPGRSEFMDGYIEAIGHVMWLSPKFWKRTGSTLQSVLQTCPEATAHKCGVVDVLKFQDTPFTSAEGLEGDLQKRIRAALFPLEGGVPHVPLPYAILRESQPILYQEWLQLTEKDRDLEYQKDISATNPKTGEVITMQEEAVKWTVNSTLFRFEDGAILADDPTEATLQKMRDLASLLNASVIPVT